MEELLRAQLAARENVFWAEYRRHHSIPSPPVTYAGDFVPHRRLNADEGTARANRRKELESLLAASKSGKSNEKKLSAAKKMPMPMSATNQQASSAAARGLDDNDLQDASQLQNPQVDSSPKKSGGRTWSRMIPFQWRQSKPKDPKAKAAKEENKEKTDGNPKATNEIPTVTSLARSATLSNCNTQAPASTASKKVTITTPPPIRKVTYKPPVNKTDGEPAQSHAQIRVLTYTNILATFRSKEPGAISAALENPWPVIVNKFYKMNPTLPRGNFTLEAEDITLNLAEFVRTPVAIGYTLKCRILRERKSMGTKKRAIYLMHWENEKTKNMPVVSTTPLMKARSEKRNGKGRYEIMLDPMEDLIPPHNHGLLVVAKLSRNFLNSKFTLSCIEDEKSKKEFKFATINFEGVIREGITPMTVRIPPMISESKRVDPPLLSRSGFRIFGRRRVRESDPDASMMQLRSKTPYFSRERNCHELNFFNRVTRLSAKNFQLIHPEMKDYIILQFGKVSEDVFTVDLKYPLCPLQAFGIVLSRGFFH